MAKPGRATFECQNCGEQVPQGARSCPECGADEETGWSADTMYDGLDLPEPGYGAESNEGEARAARGGGRMYRIVAIIVLVMLAAFLIGRFR